MPQRPKTQLTAATTKEPKLDWSAESGEVWVGVRVQVGDIFAA